MTVYNLPPVTEIWEAGRLHGQHATKQIEAFFATKEISALLNFTHSASGKTLLEKLRDTAIEASPWLGREIAGIAEGSGANLNDIWAVNLISELEWVEQVRGDHCSDVFARQEPGGAIWHGHNEDWSSSFRPLVYFVIYNTAPGAPFRPVGGQVYPGQAPGFAVTFTQNVWLTSNSLFPVGINRTGLCVVAAVREALECADAAAVARNLTRPGQAYGMNTNLVDSFSAGAVHAAYAASVEVAGAANKAHIEVASQNMTHFNNYKYLDVPYKINNSSTHRQAAADRHSSPTSAEDIISILSDTSDPDLPIYRANHTMFTVLFHSQGGHFKVWHASKPNSAKPDWETSLDEVFSASATGNIVML